MQLLPLRDYFSWTDLLFPGLCGDVLSHRHLESSSIRRSSNDASGEVADRVL